MIRMADLPKYIGSEIVIRDEDNEIMECGKLLSVKYLDGDEIEIIINEFLRGRRGVILEGWEVVESSEPGDSFEGFQENNKIDQILGK